MTDRVNPGTTRRTVLMGVGAMGVGALGAAAIAGCATSTPPPASDGGNAGNNPGNGAPVPATKQPIKVADIQVGGGAIYPDQDVVVVQPVAGQFKAFSATCTHQGCLVSRIVNDKIICPCHGSQYNLADGSVAQGPANQPLPPRTATVTGDTITIS